MKIGSLMNVEIKRVGPGDEALFDRIAPEVFDEKVTRERLAAYLREPGHHMLVALHAGEIVAQVAAVIHRHPDKTAELYLDEVGVKPAMQQRGIAGRMVDMMLGVGRELGCGEAWVGTEHDNVAARALYRRRGGEESTFVMFLYDLEDTP